MNKLISEYKITFGKYQIPNTLDSLINFTSKHKEPFSQSFMLMPDLDFKTPDMGQYSLDKDYIERIIIFAQADGTGSSYAFWVTEPDLENVPIIYMSSEGYNQVIAKNIKDLLRLLSYGPECMDGKYSHFIDSREYKSNEDYFDVHLQYIPSFEAYRKWIKDIIKIEPINDWKSTESKEVKIIIAEATKLYQKPFEAWLTTLKPQYGP